MRQYSAIGSGVSERGVPYLLVWHNSLSHPHNFAYPIPAKYVWKLFHSDCDQFPRARGASFLQRGPEHPLYGSGNVIWICILTKSSSPSTMPIAGWDGYSYFESGSATWWLWLNVKGLWETLEEGGQVSPRKEEETRWPHFFRSILMPLVPSREPTLFRILAFHRWA